MILRNTLLTVFIAAAAPHAAAQSLFSGGSAVRGNANTGQATYVQS